MEYNTSRDHLILREYGRNVQNLVRYIRSIEDKEKRNVYAKTLVELMKQINPNVKDSNEYNQKVWDDLFIVSDFDMDVDSPFPKPNPQLLDKKPQRVGYKSNEIRYRHYGRNIENFIEEASKIEEKEDQEAAIVAIGRLMKSFFQTWNKDIIEDEQVLKHMRQMSGGKLDMDIDKIKEHKLFDSSKREFEGPRHSHKGRHGKGGKRGSNRRRNRN